MNIRYFFLGFTAIPMIARRFLLAKSSDQFLSFITWVSIIGVSLGILSLTVVTSVVNGFQGELARLISGMNGDVVMYSRAEPIEDAEKVISKIKQLVPNIKGVMASAGLEGMISGSDGVSGAMIEGMDFEEAAQVIDVPNRIIEGHAPIGENEIILGKSLAEKIGAKVGDEVRVILPFSESSQIDSSSEQVQYAPKAIVVKVSGLSKMGLHDYDSKFAFTKISTARQWMGLPTHVTTFRLKLSKRSEASSAAFILTENFGYPFRAKEWSQLNKNLLYAIELEKVVIGILLAAIVIVAAFNVVSTLMMMIHDKTREIAILKTMGFGKYPSFFLFCFIGMGIGIVGVTVGVLLGLGLNWVIANTRLIELPADVYYIGYLPVIVRWWDLGMIAIFALVIILFATLYPAFQVARRSPLDGIRLD